MPKFVQFGTHIVNVDRVTGVQRLSGDRTVVRFSYHPAPPDPRRAGALAAMTPNPSEIVFDGAEATRVWDYFANASGRKDQLQNAAHSASTPPE